MVAAQQIFPWIHSFVHFLENSVYTFLCLRLTFKTLNLIFGLFPLACRGLGFRLITNLDRLLQHPSGLLPTFPILCLKLGSKKKSGGSPVQYTGYSVIWSPIIFSISVFISCKLPTILWIVIPGKIYSCHKILQTKDKGIPTLLYIRCVTLQRTNIGRLKQKEEVTSSLATQQVEN